MKKKDPCSICERYMDENECEEKNCPVYEMKQENLRLKKKLRSLSDSLCKAKSADSWDEDIRRGQVQGMW